jgi:hypothetical protein
MKENYKKLKNKKLKLELEVWAKKKLSIRSLRGWGKVKKKNRRMKKRKKLVWGSWKFREAKVQKCYRKWLQIQKVY